MAYWLNPNVDLTVYLNREKTYDIRTHGFQTIKYSFIPMNLKHGLNQWYFSISQTHMYTQSHTSIHTNILFENIYIPFIIPDKVFCGRTIHAKHKSTSAAGTGNACRQMKARCCLGLSTLKWENWRWDIYLGSQSYTGVHTPVLHVHRSYKLHILQRHQSYNEVAIVKKKKNEVFKFCLFRKM